MERLTLEQFEAERDRFDRLVLESPEIDRFCSATPWILSAGQGLTPIRRPWIWRGEHGYVALAEARRLGVRYLRPLEAMWCFASNLVARDPEAMAAEFTACCRANASQWRRILLSGVPLPGSRWFAALARHLGAHYPLYEVGRCTRYRASLAGGAEGFLSRRSRRLRQSARRARREAESLGIRYEYHDVATLEQSDDLFGRLVAVERRSWKGRSGVGVDRGRMREFYRLMVPRLLETGMLRLLFARHEETDVGYCLGGVRGPIYRGLQFSFDDAYSRVGLGNLLQLEQIRRLEAEPVDTYDLGGSAAYKARWAEHRFETLEILVER